MIRSILKYFAKRSHDVRVQCFCALFYGLISIFGISKTVLILVKLRKIQPQPKRRNPVNGANANGN